MLKLMNSVIILVILCDGIQSLNGEALQCQFQDVGFIWGWMYTCKVTSLDNSRNDMVINSYTGTHQANKNDNDVKAIWIQGTNTKYIPEGLGSFFNLTALLVQKSQLVEIKVDNFLGMQDLEYLSLSDNKLTSVPADVFSKLTKLKVIWLWSNQIKYIGSGVFDQLKNLYNVYLRDNICVHKQYEGSTQITQMKEDLKVNCVEPISTLTTTTTQNPIEVELEALKKQLSGATDEINKLVAELQTEKLEKTKIKMDHQEEQSTNDQLKSELSVLKLDLQNKVNYTKKINSEKKNLIIELAAKQKNLNENQQEKIHLINT